MPPAVDDVCSAAAATSDNNIVAAAAAHACATAFPAAGTLTEVSVIFRRRRRRPRRLAGDYGRSACVIGQPHRTRVVVWPRSVIAARRRVLINYFIFFRRRVSYRYRAGKGTSGGPPWAERSDFQKQSKKNGLFLIFCSCEKSGKSPSGRGPYATGCHVLRPDSLSGGDPVFTGRDVRVCREKQINKHVRNGVKFRLHSDRSPTKTKGGVFEKKKFSKRITVVSLPCNTVVVDSLCRPFRILAIVSERGTPVRDFCALVASPNAT